tara:strand:+ start:212 stop:430 length:219 start_codon:yes stop_codon:yes gene_type:complete
MSKDLKKLSKITTRYGEAYGFNSGGQTKIVNPMNQKYDFSKPTVVSMTKDEIMTLVNTGRIETDGLTIIYEK